MLIAGPPSPKGFGATGGAEEIGENGKREYLGIGLTEVAYRHMLWCMKAVTIHVDEPVYAQYKEWARGSQRSTSELIREAMEFYRLHSPSRDQSLREPEAPASVGRILHAWQGREDLLDDFWSRE